MQCLAKKGATALILRCIKMGLVALMTLAFTVPAASLATVSAAQGFKDTNRHWGALAIEWAAGQGIVDGYEDGTFRPDNIVSEPEFLAMLLRAILPRSDRPKSGKPGTSLTMSLPPAGTGPY